MKYHGGALLEELPQFYWLFNRDWKKYEIERIQDQHVPVRVMGKVARIRDYLKEYLRTQTIYPLQHDYVWLDTPSTLTKTKICIIQFRGGGGQGTYIS